MLLRSVARPHSVISINRLFRSVRGSSLPFPEIGATFFAKRPSFPPPRAAAHQRVGTDDNMKYTEMKFPRLEEVVKAYEFRQVRHLYLRRLPALRAPAESYPSERPRHPARRHLEGAAGARGAAARRRLEAADAFSADKVDLAAVRGDVGDLSQAQAVVVVSHMVVLVIAPPGSSIDSTDKLKGQTIGVVGGVHLGPNPDFLLGGRTSASAECRHWSGRAVRWSSCAILLRCALQTRRARCCAGSQDRHAARSVQACSTGASAWHRQCRRSVHRHPPGTPTRAASP